MQTLLFRHYVITAPDGEQYVGLTTKTLKERLDQHKYASKHNSTCRLHTKMRMLNSDNFEIVELHCGEMKIDDAYDLEMQFIKQINPTLNVHHKGKTGYHQMMMKRTGTKTMRTRIRRGTRKKFDKKLLLNVSESMVERLDALQLGTRSDAIRRCVLLGLEQLEAEMGLKQAAGDRRDTGEPA